MYKSKLNPIFKISFITSCLILTEFLFFTGCSKKEMKLVHTTAITDRNAYVGAMVSDTKVFMKTTDGGKSKELLPQTNFSIGKGVNMLDENTGWIWGKERIGGGLYEYNDLTKEFIKIPLPEGSSYVESALILDKGQGLMLDTKGSLFKTSDYGNRWEKLAEIFDNDEIKPIVKNLLTTNAIWTDNSGIHVAYIRKKDGTECHFVMKTSENEGNSFKEDFDYKLKKEPKSFTVNFRNEICVMNQDTTMDIYKY